MTRIDYQCHLSSVDVEQPFRELVTRDEALQSGTVSGVHEVAGISGKHVKSALARVPVPGKGDQQEILRLGQGERRRSEYALPDPAGNRPPGQEIERALDEGFGRRKIPLCAR